MPQEINPEMVDNLATHFPRRKDPGFVMANVESLYHQINGLRCFWNFSHSDENGNALDLVRGMTLTNVNVARTYNFRYQVVADFNSALFQYYYRDDEAALDIFGNEPWIVDLGMTVGTWVRVDSIVGNRELIAKHDVANNFAFRLAVDAGVPTFEISGNGVAWVTVAAPPIVINTWYYIVGRFFPNARLDIIVNRDTTSNLLGVPASIFNSSSPITIGAYRTSGGASGNYFIGQMAYPFYAASSARPQIMFILYEWVKAIMIT
jgi:hypothetical protein